MLLLSERIEEWYEKIGKKILYVLIGIGGIYVFFKYILELIFPFVLAWLIASLLNIVVTWLKNKFKITRGLGTLLSMVTVLSGVIGIIALIVRQLWLQIQSFAVAFDLYKRDVENFISIVEVQLHKLGDKIPLPGAFSSLDDLVKEVLGYIGSFLDEIVKGTYSVVSQVPNGVFLIIVVLIAVFFMTKDYNQIKNFIKAQVPEKVRYKMGLMQNGLKGALGGYIKTQLILMCFTFTICLVGLFVLQRQYVLLVAFGIAIFDAFPVFGSGAILIPWAIYHIVTGNYILGIGLLAVYGTIVVFRQIMEPKVLSAQIGVYPLVTLISMYIGLKTIGIFGMILGPIIMVMIQTLQRVGVFPDFKKPPK